MKLLLWDIDGTLMLTGFRGRDLMHAVGRRLFNERFCLDDLQLGGQVDLAVFQYALARAGFDHDEARWRAFRDAFADALRDELRRGRQRIQVMPGVKSILGELLGRDDLLNGLVTGNFREAAQIKLEAAGYDFHGFRPAAFGCEHTERHELVRLAIERGGNGILGRNVIVIGDTARDIACAKAHGAIAFAVATGPYGVDDLRAAGADVVVESLVDPAPLLALIDAH